MKSRIVFSSSKDDWTTPIWLFDDLNKKYDFTLDAAASDDNHLLPLYFTEEIDGLKQTWSGHRVFCNPPYSLAPEFIEKAYKERYSAELSLLLVPVRSSNEEWHKYIFPYARSITYINGRLKFGNSKLGAPFPSCLILFHHMGQRSNGLTTYTLNARGL